ncbi:polar residue-rich protein 5 [Diadegma semiclausum ichnovirus]|nr:polar residue-rich protein 5 [Diadegma semiclausum ichnovirus]
MSTYCGSVVYSHDRTKRAMDMVLPSCNVLPLDVLVCPGPAQVRLASQLITPYSRYDKVYALEKVATLSRTRERVHEAMTWKLQDAALQNQRALPNTPRLCNPLYHSPRPVSPCNGSDRDKSQKPMETYIIYPGYTWSVHCLNKRRVAES